MCGRPTAASGNNSYRNILNSYRLNPVYCREKYVTPMSSVILLFNFLELLVIWLEDMEESKEIDDGSTEFKQVHVCTTLLMSHETVQALKVNYQKSTKKGKLFLIIVKIEKLCRIRFTRSKRVMTSSSIV